MKGQKGFTLLEVLISMIVLAIGLLGMAGMQITSLRNNGSAYNKGQATQLAYDMVDRMRANKGAEKTYATIEPTSATEQLSCKQVADPCSNVQMATNDLYQWNNLVVKVLPSGQGTITYVAPVFTVSVSWDDDRNGAVSVSSDPQFVVNFIL